MTKKLLLSAVALASLVAALGGCSYGDMLVHPNGKIYVARQDRFLFGALRKLYECSPDGAGNVTCIAMEGRP
jgi:hypothetical protein